MLQARCGQSLFVLQERRQRCTESRQMAKSEFRHAIKMLSNMSKDKYESNECWFQSRNMNRQGIPISLLGKLAAHDRSPRCFPRIPLFRIFFPQSRVLLIQPFPTTMMRLTPCRKERRSVRASWSTGLSVQRNVCLLNLSKDTHQLDGRLSDA